MMKARGAGQGKVGKARVQCCHRRRCLHRECQRRDQDQRLMREEEDQPSSITGRIAS